MFVLRNLFLAIVTFPSIIVVAQEEDSLQNRYLPEIQVRAFEQNRKLRDVPAAINYVGRSALERFSPASVVQAVNTTPGVRMEERSPGSYRFNIRGSSLRSPFGVRNVKVYFNDIPITDPGGHTYLNQLGYYNFNSIEIIKGPGSSLYGAGTGGVLLIESLPSQQRGSMSNEPSSLFGEYAAGSFGLQNVYGSATAKTENSVNRAGFQHQESNGYRNHSALMRNVHSWNGQFHIGEKNLLKTTFLYGHLFYETPGALTKAEYESNPRAARPGNAFFPGAETAKASITQKEFIAGASYDQQLLPNFRNKSVLYGMFTELRNPTIQNYGRSSEPHVGGRTDFKFSKTFSGSSLNLDAGGEWQSGFTSVSIYKNVNGEADSLRTFDEINNRQALIFAQANWDNNEWAITGGASLNFLKVALQRFAPASAGKQVRQFNDQIAPRVAVMRKFNRWNIYSSISKGFSPPTTAELVPTGGAINLDLNAEEGTNYDLGVKGTFFGKLQVDINAFVFALQNTVVQRRTAGGGDYFVNAGRTKQHGVESSLFYSIFANAAHVQSSMVWASYTWHQFNYKDFKQFNLITQSTVDYSGKQLPGVAPHTLSAGWDFIDRSGLLATATYYFSDRIPLTDANNEYADAYHLLGLKIGIQKIVQQKLRLKAFAGVENLLDQKYSLGNDVNGFGGRYYNAAAGRNYYAALVIQLFTKKFGQDRN